MRPPPLTSGGFSGISHNKKKRPKKGRFILVLIPAGSGRSFYAVNELHKSATRLEKSKSQSPPGPAGLSTQSVYGMNDKPLWRWSQSPPGPAGLSTFLTPHATHHYVGFGLNPRRVRQVLAPIRLLCKTLYLMGLNPRRVRQVLAQCFRCHLVPVLYVRLNPRRVRQVLAHHGIR